MGGLLETSTSGHITKPNTPHTQACTVAGLRSELFSPQLGPPAGAPTRRFRKPKDYLQILLLTGARPDEVLELRWDDINTQWRGLTIRDKVEGERVIPLTPYVHSLIAALPHRNGWVFSSARTLQLDSQNIRRRAHKAAKRGT